MGTEAGKGRRERLKRFGRGFVLAYLACVLANILFAVQLTNFRIGVSRPTPEPISWPVTPSKPWPEPTNGESSARWGRSFAEASSIDGYGVEHHMEVRRAGWPMTVLERVDESIHDPSRTTCGQWEKRGLSARVCWIGLLAPPLGGAVLLCGFAAVGLKIVDAAIRRFRGRAGYCKRCSYPHGASPVCTECGSPVTR